MAITYDTLVGDKATEGSIRYLINYTKVDAESILRDAENWLNINLRVRRMRARAELTLADGVSTIDLSVETPLFLDPIGLWLNGYGQLDHIHEDEIDRYRSVDTTGALSESAPTCYAIVGDDLIFDVEADDDYTMVLSYYAKPEPLSDDNQTNLYTDEYPALLRNACTAYAYVERKEPEPAQISFQMAVDLISKIAMNDDLSRRGMSFDVGVS